MASRRTRSDPESLDLLLDTITNAFGGIVFLAILVVVLLQSTASTTPDRPQQDAPDPGALALQLQSLEAQLEPLETEAAAMDRVADRLEDSDLKPTLAELDAQRESRARLAAEKVDTLSRLAQLQTDIDAISQQQRELDTQLQDEAAAVDTLQSELEAERARRKIDSPFPEERSASKRPYNVCVRYGRWYVDLLPGGKFNVEDFVVLDDEGLYRTVTPKPYRGVPVSSDGELTDRVLRELEKRNPHREHITISIWDDSFEAFQPLRDYLIENGFDYRLIVLTDGDVVRYGFVADPKVQ